MKLLIVDASYYFHRVFYVSPDNPKEGIKRTLQAAIDLHQPDDMIVAFDAGKETFRSTLFPAYKANRPPSPEGYSAAVVAMKEGIRELGLETAQAPGYEADDVIGTLCARHDSYERIIIAKDKDLMQIISDGVSMCNDGTWVREVDVIEKFGVGPQRLTDVFGLSGDTSDGIPGVHGIGAKIASRLVNEYGNLESIYSRLSEIDANFKGGARISALLSQSKDMAFLSRTLATIKCDLEF